MLLRITARAIWNDGDPEDDEDVRKAAKRLAPRESKPDEAPSFFEVQEGDEPKDIACAFALDQDRPPPRVDYVLIDKEMLNKAQVDAEPVEMDLLPEYLNGRHFESSDLRSQEKQTALARAILSKVVEGDRAPRLRRKDVKARIVERRLLDRFGLRPSDLSEEWREELADYDNPAEGTGG